MFSLPCPLHFCSKVLGETVNISDLALMTSFPSYLSQFLPDRGHFGIRCSIQLFSRSTHGFWIKRRGFHQFFIYRSIPVTLFVNITSLKGFRDWEPESLCFLIIYIWANDNDGMIKKKFFSAGILAILRVIVQTCVQFFIFGPSAQPVLTIYGHCFWYGCGYCGDWWVPVDYWLFE